jgi:hypothetical protein
MISISSPAFTSVEDSWIFHVAGLSTCAVRDRDKQRSEIVSAGFIDFQMLVK